MKKILVALATAIAFIAVFVAQISAACLSLEMV